MPAKRLAPDLPAEMLVGQRLRELRTSRGFSLRSLAERSGLNFNTLSLVEKGRSSPSVSTLQQLAQALDVPITAFFESKPVEQKVVFTSSRKESTSADFNSTQIQNLGKDLAGHVVQPFIFEVKPGVDSGDHSIVHTGHEFVYCLSGTACYEIDEKEYPLHPGDSIVFEAHLPHRWKNCGKEMARILLVLVPLDQREGTGGQHFTTEYLTKELNMKIAIITEDGKTISQHFGRAPYYLVLTIEEGKVTGSEMRDKMGHSHFKEQHAEEGAQSGGHGRDAASHNKHVSMAQTIADCEALLCGGMGMGAYESMRQLNIKPIVTNQVDIEAAVKDFIDGKLIDHTELLH